MRITLKQLKNLSVETASGAELGKIHDLVIDIDGQMIVQYEIHSSRLGGKVYLVNREQVVSISETKMVVSDSSATLDNETSKNPLSISPKPIAMRQE
jgi:uncharacterized protein YrrD